jgi:hypothetical protein
MTNGSASQQQFMQQLMAALKGLSCFEPGPDSQTNTLMSFLTQESGRTFEVNVMVEQLDQATLLALLGRQDGQTLQ